MAGERWGRASFPGVNGVISCTYTLSHGTSPGAACLDVVPQLELEAGTGDLTITDGYTTITLRNCKVDRHAFERNSGGLLWRISLLDRRWKWRFGSIFGSYNRRDVQGRLIAHTVRTPRQLATLCLNEANETNFDLSGLPDEEAARLPVTWEGEAPMEALAHLAEQFGCRIVYRPLDDAVLVAKLGDGVPLPTSDPAAPLMEGGLTLDPPERPDAIRVVCAPTLINTWFALEAVGLDTDGQIKPIHKLSYAPGNNETEGVADNGDWKSCPPPYFPGLAPGANPEQLAIRALAQESVFRWYRVTLWDPHQIHKKYVDEGPNADLEPGVAGFTTPDPLKLHVFGKVDRIDQLLPIEDVQAAVPLDEEGNVQAGPEGENTDPVLQLAAAQYAPQPPVVEGVYWDGRKSVATSLTTSLGSVVPFDAAAMQATNINTAPHTRYEGNFAIDRENGVVKFEKYLYRAYPKPPPYTTGTNGFLQPPPNLVRPATLFLLTGVSVRNAITGSHFRHTRTKVFLDGQTFGTPPQIIRQDDLRLVIVPDYTDYSAEVPTEAEPAEPPVDFVDGEVVTTPAPEPSPPAPDNPQTNVKKVNQVADYYLNGAALQYQVGTPEQRTYAGIHEVFCDGAIQQVTWSIGGGGATTAASRNAEFEVKLPSYQVLRQGQKDRRVRAKLEQFKVDEANARSAAWRRSF